MKSSRAFTLIELLIVIAIIGILMALLFPAVNGAINGARRAQTKNDTVQIATAITAYETEYGRLIATNATAGDLSGNVMLALTGSNVANLNPRQIVFIEVGARKKSKSGTNALGTFVDPWNQEYQIMFDDNYDNKIQNVLDSGTIMKKVAVYSPGIPKKGTEKGKAGYVVNDDYKKFVKSWE